jgi:hypothetical protein
MSKIMYLKNGLGTENSCYVCRKQTGATETEKVCQNVLHDINVLRTSRQYFCLCNPQLAGGAIDIYLH